MLKTTIEVPTSLKRWISEARKKTANVDLLIKAAVNQSALNIVAEAVRTCPVVTGKLADSIKPEFFEDGLVAFIGSYLPYAAKWEYSVVAHPVKPLNKKGNIVGNINAAATWGFIRKALFKETPDFFSKMLNIARSFT